MPACWTAGGALLGVRLLCAAALCDANLSVGRSSLLRHPLLGETLLRHTLAGSALRRKALLTHLLLRHGLALRGHRLVLLGPHATVPPAQARRACGVWIPSGCWLRHDRPFSFSHQCSQSVSFITCVVIRSS